MNNAELLDGLRTRDPVAARHLHECFVPSIWRFVFFRVNRDPHLTEDIVAETVLTLVSAAMDETTIDNPAAWLRTVALRRIQDHYRAAARVQHLIDRAQQQPTSSDQQDPAVQHELALDREQVREAMDSLPEHYRLALEWKYVDQISVAVIATRLDTTEKGAEAMLFRARRALRARWESEQAPPPAAGPAKAAAKKATAAGPSESKKPDCPEPLPQDARHRDHEFSGEPNEATAREKTSVLFTLRLAQDP
ncbi:MAG: RNA polymerase sigma factor [Planctomycetaceae bacterium]